MKTITLGALALLTIAFAACSNGKTEKEKAGSIQHQRSNIMKNMVSIVEIPTSDFSRAVRFYQSVLGITIDEVDMDGTQMGLFPGNGETVNVALIKSNDYKPAADGALIYLNAGDDLQPTLDKVVKHGGRIIVPKTEISPEMGYFAHFIDTEGNRLGLHSSN